MDFMEIIGKCAGLDFLGLLILVGVFLAIMSYQINSPINEKLRLIGMSLAGFGVGCILSMVILGVDLRLKFLESSPRQSVDPHNSPKKHEETSGKKNSVKEDEIKDHFYEIGKWEGKGPKKTDIFHIPSQEWIIHWNTEPSIHEKSGVFTIKVFASDGTLICPIYNLSKKSGDNVIMHGSGNFYLIIDATQSYKVIVKAKYRQKSTKPATETFWSPSLYGLFSI